MIIDDTIEGKPYTDALENKIICCHFSHAKRRCIKGVNLLSSLIRYGDVSLPVSIETAITKNGLFRSQVKEGKKNEVSFEYIPADNWFGAKKNIEFIKNKIEI
ncbi:MAG: hypothetical protein P0S93_00290 [Candidatus Neptunochlamydia sp.]|nr:hypothetical protein [Candidatus Neptunochlamydia sp.]